jgi:uncharacterized protein (TIGR02246 family)
MRRALFSAILLFATSALGAGLSDADAADVRKVMNRYVTAWLAGDADTVMGQLTADSVLVPGDKAPHVGAAAIRAYWWPPNAPKFALDRFENTVDAIEGSGDCAVVRGRQVLEWTSGGERWRTRGNFVSVLRRTRDGWRISMQMAANTPNERLAK